MINTLILKREAPTVYDDILNSVGEESVLVDRELDVINMDTRLAFDAYLRYNGIIGYTDDIMNALDAIRKAETPRR